MKSKRYNTSKSLGEILKDVLEQSGYQARFDEAKAVEAWIELAGPHINAVTTDVYARNNVLFVELNSGMWRQEMHLGRKLWCEKLNQTLGKPIIKAIVFR